MSTTELLRRVREANAWCSEQFLLRGVNAFPQLFLSGQPAPAPEACDRRKRLTGELWPETTGVMRSLELDSPLRDAKMLTDHTGHRREALVADVVRRRREAVGDRRPPLLPGRLLFHVPDQTDVSGGGLLASSGFLDWDDAPPWDTWIGLIPGPSTPHDVLLAWIPQQVYGLAEDGIWGAPLRHVDWALGLELTGYEPEGSEVWKALSEPLDCLPRNW